jgi:hypothetical protein
MPKQFNTITLSIPATQLVVSNGKVSNVNTLTEKGNIKTKSGKKAIKLVPNNTNDVKIVNDGKDLDKKKTKKALKTISNAVSNKITRDAIKENTKINKAQKTLAGAFKGYKARKQLKDLQNINVLSDNTVQSAFNNVLNRQKAKSVLTSAIKTRKAKKEFRDLQNINVMSDNTVQSAFNNVLSRISQRSTPPVAPPVARRGRGRPRNPNPPPPRVAGRRGRPIGSRNRPRVEV